MTNDDRLQVAAWKLSTPPRLIPDMMLRMMSPLCVDDITEGTIKMANEDFPPGLIDAMIDEVRREEEKDNVRRGDEEYREFMTFDGSTMEIVYADRDDVSVLVYGYLVSICGDTINRIAQYGLTVRFTYRESSWVTLSRDLYSLVKTPHTGDIKRQYSVMI